MIAQTNNSYQNPEFRIEPRLDIESLVKVKLPAMKSSVLRIMELLRAPDVSIPALSAAVGCDPILAARVLRLANSPFYSRQKSVSTIQKAIEAVGTRALYDMVILDTMAEGFTREIRHSILIRTVWEHSIAVGLLSREIVKIIGLRGGEEAFVCGLLHDIGKILMLRTDIERLDSMLDQKTERQMLDWEERVYGFDHTEVGAYVANRWRLPEGICGVIMYHHQPSQAKISMVLANVVNAADNIANVYGYGLRLEDETVLQRAESIALLNLGRNQMLRAWDNIQEPFEEIISTFK
jgi:putative nucleotidyltransferase with HDIG domain